MGQPAKAMLLRVKMAKITSVKVLAVFVIFFSFFGVAPGKSVPRLVVKVLSSEIKLPAES